MTTQQSESERLIELITAHTKTLLQNHWGDIQAFRDGDGEIKVGFSHGLAYAGQGRTIKTTISFAQRVKDVVEESIDLDQMTLALTLPKRGRPRKTTILTENL